MKTWMILTGRKGYDLECQIVVHSAEQAKREIKDLKSMGCEDARAKVFETEAEAYNWLNRANGVV